MSVLLNLFYLSLFLLFSPWLLWKSLTTGKYRRGLMRKFLGSALARSGTGRCAWFHGVSVGEIHLLRQVIARFRQRHPDWECVISTTTDTGFEEACKRFPDLPVFFWPFDFSWAVRRALHRVRPDLVVLAEGELWPNFLRAARRAGIPVAVANTRMSPRSFARYRRLRGLARHVIRLVDRWAVQTEEYAAHLRSLGAAPERLRVTGSVKYDGVETDRRNPRTQTLRTLLGLGESELVWIAGSTQPPEEEVALGIFHRLRPRFPNLRLLLVPRQKERFGEVAEMLRQAGTSFTRRSEVTSAEQQPVILVDTIGELGALWGLADVAFVGGSMDGRRGGQNMIEPAGYGAAVVFGPHVWNFKDTATRLVEHGAAVQVADPVTLETEVGRLLADAAARRQLGGAAQRFVLSQQGATERTIDVLDDLIGPRGKLRSAA